MDSTSSSRLPLELWHVVFKMLVQQYARQPQQPDRYLLEYACVNRDWQAFFEKEYFQRLTVSPKRMHQQLGNMVPRQRRLVRHVWFQIEMATYPCDCCHKPRGDNFNYRERYWERCYKDIKIAQQALHGIFSILKNWSRGTGNDGLTLEIGLHSPSDFHYRFQHYGIDSSFTQAPEHSSIGYQVLSHNPTSGCVSCCRTAIPSLWSNMMLYDFVFMEESLPTVDVVHRLLVRRQTRRILSVKLWENMVKALPNLECLHQELWRVRINIDHLQSRSVVSGVLRALCYSSDLKKLVAFGEIKPSLAPGPYEALSEDLISEELKSDELIHRLAMRTCKLEQLCLSYVVDAFKFLLIAEGQPALHWLKLETLALTSPSFHIGNEAGIMQMLETAAKLARKMPELRTLELWNAGKSHAFAFTCRITPFAVEVLYRATWEFKLAGSVEKLWEDLAQERNQGHKVCVQRGQLINASEWKSHGDAIHALNLTADVIHPVSLMQIRRGEIISPAEMPPMEQQ